MQIINKLEARVLSARDMVSLLTSMGGEGLITQPGSTHASSSGGGSSSGPSTGVDSGRTDGHLAASSLHQQLAAPVKVAIDYGGSALGDSAAPLIAATVAGSWLQRTRAAIAAALPPSCDPADTSLVQLQRGDGCGEHAAGTAHRASCTVAGCRRCQYETWRLQHAAG